MKLAPGHSQGTTLPCVIVIINFGENLRFRNSLFSKYQIPMRVVNNYFQRNPKFYDRPNINLHQTFLRNFARSRVKEKSPGKSTSETIKKTDNKLTLQTECLTTITVQSARVQQFDLISCLHSKLSHTQFTIWHRNNACLSAVLFRVVKISCSIVAFMIHAVG